MTDYALKYIGNGKFEPLDMIQAEEVENDFKIGEIYKISDKPMTERCQRTTKQNASMHLWFRRISERMNAHGVSFKSFFRKDFDLPWDKDGMMFKYNVWRPLQKISLDKEKTRDLSTDEVQVIYNMISDRLCSLDIVEPWPDMHSQSLEGFNEK